MRHAHYTHVLFREKKEMQLAAAFLSFQEFVLGNLPELGKTCSDGAFPNLVLSWKNSSFSSREADVNSGQG